eukprot:gene16224-17860_t
MLKKLGKFLSFLDIGYWNIHGISQSAGQIKVSKLDDEEFINTVKHLDIFALAECHVGPDKNLLINNFESFSTSRERSSNNRYYGGLTLFVRKFVRPGVKILNLNSSEIIWLKLEKSFFYLEEDIFIALLYAPPHNSPFLQKINLDISSFFQKLEEDISSYKLQGKVLLLGDFNAYTSTLEDYIDHDSIGNNHFIHLPTDYTEDFPMRRVNLDIRAPNENGKLLLQLCKSSSLRIANGRIAGDELGCFTRYPLHDNRDVDPSVIDYSLISENLLPEVQRFTVNKLTSLSDHCCISTRITTNCFISLPAKNETDNVDMSPIPARFLWNPDSADNFTAALTEPAILDRLVSFQNSVFSNDQNGTDEAVNQLTNIILDVATTSISKSTKRFKGKRIKKNPQKKWFTKDCQVTKNKLSRLANKLRQCPFDRDLQQKYRALYFHYKTMIRKAAKTYNNDLKDKLLSIERTTQKCFGI